MTRLQEIEQRLSAIREEMNADGANLDALNSEVDSLISERNAIRTEVEKRKGILNKIGSGALGSGEPIAQPEEQRSFDVSSPEYRRGCGNTYADRE